MHNRLRRIWEGPNRSKWLNNRERKHELAKTKYAPIPKLFVLAKIRINKLYTATMVRRNPWRERRRDNFRPEWWR